MFKVIEAPRPAPSALPGIAHATLASAADGASQLSVWHQLLEAGAATPPHSHHCDEVVQCLSGSGEVRSGGRRQRFGAGAIVVLPRDEVHQLLNVGASTLELMGMFGSSPVVTLLPDGQAIELPWPT
jgi:quercetin dioxygenase-like cupin family protein